MSLFSLIEQMKKRIDQESNVFIWPHEGILKAISFNAWPKELVLGPAVYTAFPRVDWSWTDEIFWGSLRNDQKQLVGFDLHIVEREEITKNESLMKSRGVSLDRGVLKLIIQDTDSYEVGGEEGFPVVFYQDQEKNLLLGIHNFGPWGDVAFEVERELTPVPR